MKTYLTAVLVALVANGLAYFCAEKSDAERRLWAGALCRLSGVVVVAGSAMMGLFLNGVIWFGAYMVSLVAFMFLTAKLEDRASKKRAEEELYQLAWNELPATDFEFYNNLTGCREFRDKVFAAMDKYPDCCWTILIGDNGKEMYCLNEEAREMLMNDIARHWGNI